jgi:hypothetical protein
MSGSLHVNDSRCKWRAFGAARLRLANGIQSEQEVKTRKAHRDRAAAYFSFPALLRTRVACASIRVKHMLMRLLSPFPLSGSRTFRPANIFRDGIVYKE